MKGMVEKLLEKDPKLIESRDDKGQTPIHLAASISDDISILVELLEGDSSVLYIQDNSGQTVAHIAALCDNLEGLKKLIEKAPDCCESEDNKGLNVVHLAASQGCVKALEYFFTDSHFWNIINKRDKEGNTPIHLLANSLKDLSASSLSRVKRILLKLKEMELRVFNKANLTPEDIAHSYDIFELEKDYQNVVRE